jgi:NAD(P)-dependent dehydrogenase (short-subunit alcohol dehydrogenase family)
MIDLAGYGKVVIITGCSSGIGLATVLIFLKHQYQVFGIDITAFDYKVLDHLNRGQFQEKFHFHLGDLTQPGECAAAVRICIAEFG